MACEINHNIRLVGAAKSRMPKRIANSRSKFPNSETLSKALTSILCGNRDSNDQVRVLDRQPNVYASTFPTEFVTCLLADGSKMQLFCKYEAGRTHKVHGHRGDVAYEADVYHHVLRPLQVSAPKFYGRYVDDETGDTWLILESLAESVRVTKTCDPVAMRKAARWIGRFHADSEMRLAKFPRSLLKRYDTKYYLGWVRRTFEFTRHLHQRFHWLGTLCERFESAVIPLLLAPPQTVIHGEYYPSNILFNDGIISPVDWESAAIAVGEIDLACLTEEWPAGAIKQCKLEYQRGRWPNGWPSEFERTLSAAQLYLFFRWLGDRQEWTISRNSLGYIKQLRSAGEKLGLI
jgi:hypothetical protein